MAVRVVQNRAGSSHTESESAFILTSPANRLLGAAISGLFAVGVSGCPDDSKPAASSGKGDLSDSELKALCSDMVTKAVAAQKSDAGAPDLDSLCADKLKGAQNDCPAPDVEKVCADKVKDALTMCPMPDLDKVCADKVKDAQAAACAPKTKEDKVINSEQKEYTFAQLTAMCDSRGGYTQIHASCGGENTCKGFSYGDWGPGAATLTEHSCTGANGCLGLSCIVDPPDPGTSGADVYTKKYDDPGPNACTSCHAPEDEKKKPDLTKFNLYLHAGSTRTADNWLDRPAAEQERVVAFGVHGIEPGGPATQTMAPYSQFLSRKEIERVVAHIRTLKVVVQPIKLVDKP
jgi:hypothetical protein